MLVLGWPKFFQFLFFFFCKMALVVLSAFNFIQNNLFFRLYCDSYHISVHLKKKTLSKLVNFYIAILIFNMDKRRKNWYIMLYYFEKGKSETEIQKNKLCSEWRRCCDWWTCQKWFAEFHAGDFSLDNAA